jgi:MFS family permease
LVHQQAIAIEASNAGVPCVHVFIIPDCYHYWSHYLYGLIGAETLIPLFMQNMRGFTAFEAGLAILPGALITGIMSPFIGRIFDRIGARWLVIGGLLLITASSFTFMDVGPSTSFTFIMVMYSIRMFGLAMVMMPVSTAALNQLPKRLIAHGAAMDNTM